MSAIATPQSYLDQTASSGLTTAGYTSAPYGAGIAAGDLDGDGDMDLILSGDPGQPLQLFENLGGLQFAERTATSGLGTVAGYMHGLTLADIDNDGDQDLFVCNWRTPATLFVNNGAAVFSEEAALRGITSSSSAFNANFGDYDRDGWLDLYIANRQDPVTGVGQPNILYRNLGGGHFVDVTATAGVGGLGMTCAAGFVDYDEDGWLDIYTANDKGWQLQQPNELYRNLGDGTFQTVGAQVGANSAIDGMGFDFADAFGDGGVDLACADSPIDHLFLMWDPTQSSYVDQSIRLGLFAIADGWATHFFDYNNDGWQDLHIVMGGLPNSLFQNPGPAAVQLAPWSDVAAAAGLAQTRPQFTTAVADFDDDGHLDLCHRYELGASPFAVALMHNQGNLSNWIKFRLVGTASNRDGIGARVTIEAAGRSRRDWIRCGTGLMSSSDLRLHFGLGDAMQVDRVEVLWPSGQRQVLGPFAANQILTLEEPSLTLGGPVAVGGTTSFDLSVPREAGLPYAMVLSFSNAPSPLPGGRMLPLTPDALSGYTIVPGNVLLPNSLGVLGPNGGASSPLLIPNQQFLSGLLMYGTAATFEPQGFPAVRTLFPSAVEILVQ